MSLQIQFETEDNWNVDGTEDATMHEAPLNMSEEDDIWTFIKDHVVFFGKIGKWKS